jgi:anti-anti-sigma regulatory factor
MIRYRDNNLGPTVGYLRITLSPCLDLEALRDFRSTIKHSGNVRQVVLDFSNVLTLDPSAVRLLEGDLIDLQNRGVAVVARHLPARIAQSLTSHPIRRFEGEDDMLFTDPDLDRTGFQPSDR